MSLSLRRSRGDSCFKENSAFIFVILIGNNVVCFFLYSYIYINDYYCCVVRLIGCPIGRFWEKIEGGARNARENVRVAICFFTCFVDFCFSSCDSSCAQRKSHGRLLFVM